MDFLEFWLNTTLIVLPYSEQDSVHLRLSLYLYGTRVGMRVHFTLVHSDSHYSRVIDEDI